MTRLTGGHDKQLFWGCFVAMIATSFAFISRVLTAGAWGTEFGLTAGLFSREDSEIRRFFDRIEAGVVYVNRRAGATTGAWPGINPFGGWKGSGSSGKASGGPYYVAQFMREQSRTLIKG